MTHHPDKAREAARIAARFFVGTEAADVAIDAFLITVLEGADGRVAEIQKLARNWADIASDEDAAPTGSMLNTVNYLLTLVTALSAEKESLRAEYKAIYDRCDKLESQLTVQKAAHAKMLRDEAERCAAQASSFGPMLATAAHAKANILRRLADRIEGGD